MKLPMLALLCASALLGGCVAFERSPVTGLTCDPALAGRWLPLDHDNDGLILVDTDCNVTLREENDGDNSMRFSARGFSHGGMNYLVMQPAIVQRILDEGDSTEPLSDLLPPDAVFLLQYRMDADVMSMSPPPPEAITPLLASGQMRILDDESGFGLLEGSARQLRKVLTRQGDWRTSDNMILWQFQREATEAATPALEEPLS